MLSLEFTPFNREAIPLTRPYFATQTDRFCDWTIGTTYMWRQVFTCRWAIAADCLILQTKYIDGQDYFSYPLGNGDKAKALTVIEFYCKANGLPLQFCSVSPTNTEQLKARYGACVTVQEQRDFYDYLYNYEDLATFAGRRYSGQRNHINQFTNKWPHWQYVPLTPDRLPAVWEFLAKIETDNVPLSPLAQADLDGSRDMLEILFDVDMVGGCILVDGQVAAFSVGERQGDTLYTHIEKGDRRYPGVFQLMVREFAAHNGGEDLLYINREDDSGDEGLRRSKMAYRPCAILQKNIVTVQKEV